MLSALFAHLACSVVAIARYPGGTWCDRQTVGYSLWSNFLCDLLHEHALNGAENPGSGPGQLGLVALVIAIATFWSAVSTLDSTRRGTSRAIRVSGGLAVALMMAVLALPSDRFGSLHGRAVMAAGAPGFLAMTLSLTALGRKPGYRVLAVVGGLALAFGMADMAWYAKAYFGGGDCVPALPLLQRVAVLLLLGFLVGLAVALFGTDADRMR